MSVGVNRTQASKPCDEAGDDGVRRMCSMSPTDEELIAIARRVATTRGYRAELAASVTARTPLASVQLTDPAFARGGGLLVVIDLPSGAVVKVVPLL
jgi:hypothetical protein